MAVKRKQKIEEVLTADFYSRYSGLLVLSDMTMMIVDLDGKILYEFIPSPDFCKYVCQKEQSQICPMCMDAMRDGEEATFVCPNGLKNIAVPIKEDENTVAYVIGSRVYSHTTEYQKYMLDIPKLAQKCNLDAEIAISVA